MAELRKNPLTREWVIVTTEPPSFAEAQDGCPYCPGNEQRCGPELLAYRDPNTPPDTPGWWVRVVSSGVSQFDSEGDLERHDEGIYDMMRTVGADEIVIETPTHDESALVADAQQSEDALWACRERYARWCAPDLVKSVVISRYYPAHDPEHPHWRLLALPVVPQRLWELAKGLEQYYDYRGRCGICHIAEADREDGQRMVVENRHFVALAPYASTYPYELWIIPRRHQASLACAQRQEMQSLARILADAMRALKGALHNPRCVLTFMCAPCNIEGMEHFHWFLRVLPNVIAPTRAALKYGICVNPVAPETAAHHLRRSAVALLASRP